MKILNIISILAILVSTAACTQVTNTNTSNFNETPEINQKDVTDEVTNYVSCVCCCPEDNPPEKCLYRSKGERIEDIIDRDKANTTDCSMFGCSRSTKYVYCD